MTPNEATISKSSWKKWKREDESSQKQSQTVGELNSPPFTHQDYTVGWICALSKEQTAATAMLDQIHPDLPKPAYDQNAYTLGSIGKHNIVIACLPKGRYATIPAAKVATWMAVTFPSVRVGLMVGIGGGIPSNVRLGDVVVSTPTADYPGVVQWDMGKAEDGGRFHRTGFLNEPPTALLTALTKLETQHAMCGTQIPQYLDDMVKRWPALAIYLWSDSLRDPLAGLESSVSTQENTAANFSRHQVKQATNNTVNADTGENKGRVTVHYGLVASGNQVIKDANVRDRLNESFGGNVLCVEMEAAGLVKDFPCIVIRGICDYADSGKNKDWQEYAAAVAAAYAKELLEITDPVEIKHTPEARAVIHELREIRSMTKEICGGQKQQMEDQKRSKLFEWLSPLSPSARHFENQKQRVEGTGVWLLEDPNFLAWSSTTSSPSVLCCYGDPGAGKTIISDVNAQTAENVLGAMLRQILRSLPVIPASIWQLYQERRENTLPFSLADAKHFFQVISVEFSKLYVCLDALDELGDQRGVMEFLRDRPSNIQLFLTGRPHIRDTVQKYLKDIQDVLIVARESDLQQFIEREIGGPNDAEPDAMDDELRTRIVEKVFESARGIFLLPVLQIRAVLQNLTISEREKSLETLPSNLGEAFAGTFARIEQQSNALSTRAAHIIAWIHLAKWSLTVNELLCSLTVKNGDKSFDVRGVPVRKTLLNCCHGLVVIDQETSTVRLVHYSLQEHLHQQTELFKVSIMDWHARMAATCLTFLSFPHLIGKEELTTNSVHRALLGYSTTQWGHHLRSYEELRGVQQVPPAVFELAIEYLRTGWKTNPESWRLLQDSIYEDRSRPLMDNIQGHIGAFFGVRYIILHLSSTGYNLDVIDVTERTPLLWASVKGYEAVARLLIEKGAKVDSTAEHYSTPLSWASRRGYSVVARLLIEKDARVDSKHRDGSTPLSWASQEGHEAVARLLIEKGAAVDSADENGRTPLSCASLHGHEVVVRLLIKKGATVDSTNRYGRTPLSFASQNGHETIVQLLVKKGATVDSTNRYGRTPLSFASQNGHTAVVQHLIEKGAPVDSRDSNGRTPLIWASQNGHEVIVQLLIEKGAVVDSIDGIS